MLMSFPCRPAAARLPFDPAPLYRLPARTAVPARPFPRPTCGLPAAARESVRPAPPGVIRALAGAAVAPARARKPPPSPAPLETRGATQSTRLRDLRRRRAAGRLAA